ncbi:transposase [Streptomyces sp. NPDC090442]|uniref:transposase n=1 Tax=Streptomyces sp. NPDC090442 TaxID=3365962 RepID=UPI0037F4858E
MNDGPPRPCRTWVPAVDAAPRLRPDAATCPARSCCHTYGRGQAEHHMIPGWPRSIVAALETGRSSWTTALDAIRLAAGAPDSPTTTRLASSIWQQNPGCSAA